MKNPFAYSNYVTGESFCNRVTELAELMQYIKGSQNVLLYAHRRYGKSSLIKQAFKKIREEKMDIGVFYVELYGTVSEQDFISRTFQALSQLESNFERLIHFFGNAAKNIKLNFTIDDKTGQTCLSPSFGPSDQKIMLEELMGAIEKYSKKRKMAIAFDEFQEVAGYTEEGFEKRIRSFIQRHDNICYIFAGSQRRLLTEMFNSNNRAFYKMADSFPLDRIETKSYIPWVNGLFMRKNVTLPPELIEEIVERFENHPMYIQNFLFHLWEEPDESVISTETIQRIESRIIEKKNPEFNMLWETLTINQKKTLKLIIKNKGANLFAADALQSVNLKTGSLVSKALSSLSDKDIIQKNGSYGIQDILFRKWLEQTLSF